MEMSRIKEAVKYSRKKLEPFRKHRLEALLQYVGYHYSDNGSPSKVPLNYIELAVSIYRQQIVARLPQVLCTSYIPEYKPYAATLEQALNKRIKKIKLDKTLRALFTDSLISMGIAKVGLEDGGEVMLDGQPLRAGSVYCDHVSIDDWVHDATARRMEDIQFCGNRYRLPVETIKNCGLFENVADLTPERTGAYGHSKEAADLSAADTARNSEYSDMADLWDLYFPRENAMRTFTCVGNELKDVIRETEWEGPDNGTYGPYYFLSFNDVPDNIMPLPPVAAWMDIHTLSNNLYNKLSNQAERQKTLGLVPRGGDGDAETIKNAVDGELIGVDNPQSAKEISFGGIDQSNFAFTVQNRDLFSWFAGNLDSIGGLSPQADTATQEKLLAISSNKRVALMQGCAVDFTGELINAIAHYVWNDPVHEETVYHDIPGIDNIKVPAQFGPNNRQGELEDYKILVEPYSMQHRTPQERLDLILATIERVYMPLAPQNVNIENLNRVIIKLSDLPELAEIIQMQGVPAPEDAAAREQGVKPPVTSRTYTRVNRPGATRQGSDNTIAQMLMGGRKQPAEEAVMGRVSG